MERSYCLRSIKKGDFLQIDPGTVHAIKRTLILKPQNSDITYRLYDYDRLDNGKPREPHIDKSIDVIRCPHVDAKVGGKITRFDTCEVEELIQNQYYSVSKIKIHGRHIFEQNKLFLNVSVIEGKGEIDGIP